jgi:hypothetical protein
LLFAQAAEEGAQGAPVRMQNRTGHGRTIGDCKSSNENLALARLNFGGERELNGGLVVPSAPRRFSRSLRRALRVAFYRTGQGFAFALNPHAGTAEPHAKGRLLKGWLVAFGTVSGIGKAFWRAPSTPRERVG